MLLPVNEARSLAEAALLRGNLPREEAAIISDILIESELRGRKTHGLIRLKGIIASYKSKTRTAIEIIREKGHWAHVDAGNNIGYYAAYRGMQIAINKAKEFGSGLVGVCNANHCGMAGYYASMALEQDFIGLMMCDCRPRIVPFGGVEAVLGTNPIAVAIPSQTIPIIADLSSASITIGDLLVAMRLGTKVDPDFALDREGNPTDDPQRAMEGAVQPFGGHKGYALATVIQILSGALVGAATIPDAGTDYGYFFLVIDPSIFLPIEVFKRKVAELTKAIKSSRKAKGVEEILAPGERALREKERRLKEGIGVEDDLLSELKPR